jgi:LuxR family maltose regulon positive regulatory protein
VDDAVIQRLTERTEGWPVGLYLAGLVLAKQAGAVLPDATLGGDDRYLVDYIRAEVLSRLPPDEVRFLTRTAVLPVMCAEVCDAVLEQTGSQYRLESIERSNQLLVPMDRQRRWYRYHDLFRDALVAHLQATDPETMRRLQQRAITWFAANQMPERAFELAMSLGDLDQAREQLEQLVIPVFNDGRLSTLVTWTNRFTEEVVERHLTLAIVSAWVGMMTGDPVRAERWARVAARLRAAEGPASTSAPTPYHTFRAHLCPDGAEAMLADAEAALREVPEAGHWRPPTLFIHALALLLAGRPDAADLAFHETAEVAGSRVVPATTMALAERSLLASERGDWASARDLSDRSRELVGQHHLEEYPFSGITFAVAARVAIHRGDGATARAELRRAQRLLPLLTSALPWLAIQVRIEMARAMVALIDVAGARIMLYECDQILRRIPDLGRLVTEAAELRRQLESVTGQMSSGAPGLTTAELRLMPYLPTHLSFREIAERLYVSETTIKTQAVSVYRKLGVASRSDAVERASRLGYVQLDPILSVQPAAARP